MKALRCLLITINFIFSLVSYTQNLDGLSSSNLNNINIDELSDEQIQQFLDKVKENGLTLEQAELIAKQRGVSSFQLSKFRDRIRLLQADSSRREFINISPNRSRKKIEEGDNLYSFLLFPSDSLQGKGSKLKIFGMDIFRRLDINFEPSLNAATPEGYILGTGDEIIIDVFGASEITYQQFISPNGKILIRGVGPVSLGGLTVRQAKVRLFNRLSTIYSGLKGQSPNTFINVSIGDIRSIRVNVVGAVTQPGTYTISSFSTAFNVLYSAGGPGENGSMREIQIIRKGEKIATLDIYKYLFLGEDSQNPQLLDQDIVLVKPYLNRVKLAGNVKNPAIYELKEDETVDFLLSVSGGFSEKAFKESITIDRVGKKEKRIKTVNVEHFSLEQIQNGDSIFVTSLMDTYSNRIRIQGAVNRPGIHELTKELSLSKVISLAGGLREDAYLKRGNIIRLTDSLRLTNLTFDVKEVTKGNQDILLSPEDLIVINSIFDLEEKKLVTIQGQVQIPGDYPFVSDMSVEDLIKLAGGLKENANVKNVEVARRLLADNDLSKSSDIFTFPINKDLSVNEQASSFKLMPFDIVLIKSTQLVRDQKTVKIEGEVKYPGFYALETNEDKISDLLKRAGGLTIYGYAEGAYLIRRTDYYGFNSETEEIPAKSDLLEGELFKAQQIRDLLLKDSISDTNELIEKQRIGINLPKILEQPNSKFDLILKNGDLISIPQKLETVRVRGEVLYPNTVKFTKGASFKKYISASGGFSSKAKVGKSYVIYANGSAQRTKNFLLFKNFPSVKPGADILIPVKKEQVKLSSTEIVGIASGLASLAFIVFQIVNLNN
ncbi:MAG: SLBB domain-containing protein [Ekhidna sp.]|nr:SLBB domain-containing protein [Ekhidna sp.]